MLDANQTELLNIAMKRIFALPITRSTYREIQNTLYKITKGNTEKTNYYLELIYRGESVKWEKNNESGDIFNTLIKDFSISTKLAKDILERGEFISLITSDLTNAGGRFFLINRLRKVDGEEFQFLTDGETTFHLSEHFIGRLLELKNADPKQEFSKTYKDQISHLKTLLEALI